MGAEAVEGGASLFRKEYVGLGLDIRMHNLHRVATTVRASRLVTSIGTGPLLSPVSPQRCESWRNSPPRRPAVCHVPSWWGVTEMVQPPLDRL